MQEIIASLSSIMTWLVLLLCLVVVVLLGLIVRDMAHVASTGVTRSPTDAWTAQQLQEATSFGQSPRVSHS